MSKNRILEVLEIEPRAYVLSVTFQSYPLVTFILWKIPYNVVPVVGLIQYYMWPLVHSPDCHPPKQE